MKFALVTFRLRDGCTAVLRTPDPARDAADMVQYLRDAAAETPFVLRLPEEIAYTVEGEERFLRGVADSPNDCFIVCEVEGRIAGNSHLSFSTLAKTCHSCTVAIALRKAYWGNSIGTAMFEVMGRAAREREGVRQIDLEVIDGNMRARALYEKMGFRVVGSRPDAICQRDGSLHALCLMQKKL